MRPTTGRTCNAFVETKWDNLCKNCRTSKAQHQHSALQSQQQTASDVRARIADERREKDAIYRFFNGQPFCAQRTIVFKNDAEGTVDERVRTRVPFQDGRFPLEILEATFRPLSPQDKHNMRRTCVSLFTRLSELAPPEIIFDVKGHVVSQSVSTHGNFDICSPYVTSHIRFASMKAPKIDDLKCGTLVYGYTDRAEFAPYGTLESSRKETGHNAFEICAYFDTDRHESRYSNEIGTWIRKDGLKPHSGLTRFLGKNCFIQPYVENVFGLSLAPAIHLLVPQRNEVELYNYCFSEQAPIHLINEGTRPAREICVGDRLKTPEGAETTVTLVKTTPHYTERGMVDMGDYMITVGHPIFVDGEWYRPDELFPVVRRYVTCVYNFYCQPHHFIVVGKQNPTVASSLGGYCPRIAEMDPYTDILYGRGYGTALSLRYAWLLTLKERIPDESVEEETEKYWALQNAKEKQLQDQLLLSY